MTSVRSWFGWVFAAALWVGGCGDDMAQGESGDGVDGRDAVDAVDVSGGDGSGAVGLGDGLGGDTRFEGDGIIEGDVVLSDGFQGDGEDGRDGFDGDMFGGDTIAPDTLADGFDSFDGTAGDVDGGDTFRDGDVGDIDDLGDVEGPDGFDTRFDDTEIGVEDAFVDAPPSDGNLEETHDKDIIPNDSLEVGPDFDSDAFDSMAPDDTMTPFETGQPPETIGPETVDF